VNLIVEFFRCLGKVALIKGGVIFLMVVDPFRGITGYEGKRVKVSE